MISLVIALMLVTLYAIHEGIHRCQDGDRYTSSTPQPTPFNRRFHRWPPRLLMVLTWLSFVAIGSTLQPLGAVLFLTLPGVVFCVSHPTTVDGPSMALAWLSSLTLSHYPALAVALSLASGAIHERGPVFASLYALSPLPLLGLLAVQWWATPREPKHPKELTAYNLHEHLVGRSFFEAIRVHRPYQDLLGQNGLVWALRGVPAIGALCGASLAGWLSLLLAFLSRPMGTDTGRALLWASPALIAGLGDVPLWALALHVMTFQRMV